MKRVMLFKLEDDQELYFLSSSLVAYFLTFFVGF